MESTAEAKCQQRQKWIQLIIKIQLHRVLGRSGKYSSSESLTVHRLSLISVGVELPLVLELPTCYQYALE